MTATPEVAWRLVRAPFADLSGRGAERHGGRWNSPGRPMVYLSLEASLPVLEVLVHLDLPPEMMPEDYLLMRVDLGQIITRHGEASVETWPGRADEPGETRRFGDRWLAERRTPLLRVPSRIVEEASNLLLNPMHPATRELGPPRTRAFTFDPRLLPPTGLQ